MTALFIIAVNFNWTFHNLNPGVYFIYHWIQSNSSTFCSSTVFMFYEDIRTNRYFSTTQHQQFSFITHTDYVYWAVRREYLNKVQHDPGLQENVTIETIVLFVSDVGSLDWTPPSFLTLSVLLLSLNVLMCVSRVWQHRTLARQNEVCGWISSGRRREFTIALITNEVMRRRFNWGTAVQAVRSRVGFPIRFLLFFIFTDLICTTAVWHWGRLTV